MLLIHVRPFEMRWKNLHSSKSFPLIFSLKKQIILCLIFLCVMGFFLCLTTPTAHAAGLIDQTIDASNEYSKYSMDHYQLDYYVDTTWDWLPWNWKDGIGKQVMYGLFAITNFLWGVNLFVSNATGILIQEAYSIDFIGDASHEIGRNMQEIAGVSSSGISLDGFYAGFLLLIILVVGVYVTYTGLIKRETTKAMRAVMSFVMIFVLSAAFLAYAPEYVAKINEFSSDVSSASLTVGTKIAMPNSDSQGKDSVALIRENIFAIQVKQPWLLLQFGNSDIGEIGEDRVDALLSIDPNENNGKTREEAVKAEIEDAGNTNLTVTQTMNRMGMMFFLLIINLAISIFLFLLTGIMIFSQVLFIIYTMFLPISFLLSMLPNFESLSKRAIIKLFNVIMLRAGITFIITIAFSISTMFYRLTGEYPFFVVAFLQIVTFAGIYMKLDDFMSMFSLHHGETKQFGRQMTGKAKRAAGNTARRLQRGIGRAALGVGAGVTAAFSRRAKNASANHAKGDRANVQRKNTASLSKRAGAAVGTAMDMKHRVSDKAGQIKEQIQDLPVNASYAMHMGKRKAVQGVRDFTSSVTQTRTANVEGRQQQRQERRQTIAQRRAEMGWTTTKASSSTTEESTAAYARSHSASTAAYGRDTRSHGTSEKSVSHAPQPSHSAASMRQETPISVQDKESSQRSSYVASPPMRERPSRQETSAIREPVSDKTEQAQTMQPTQSKGTRERMQTPESRENRRSVTSTNTMNVPQKPEQMRSTVVRDESVVNLRQQTEHTLTYQQRSQSTEMKHSRKSTRKEKRLEPVAEIQDMKQRTQQKQGLNHKKPIQHENSDRQKGGKT